MGGRVSQRTRYAARGLQARRAHRRRCRLGGGLGGGLPGRLGRLGGSLGLARLHGGGQPRDEVVLHALGVQPTAGQFIAQLGDLELLELRRAGHI
jgi:hypothetical protein